MSCMVSWISSKEALFAFRSFICTIQQITPITIQKTHVRIKTGFTHFAESNCCSGNVKRATIVEAAIPKKKEAAINYKFFIAALANSSHLLFNSSSE